jgi:hypothetical protein
MHPTAFYSWDGCLGGHLFLVNLIPLRGSPDISGVLPSISKPVKSILASVGFNTILQRRYSMT